MAKTRATDWRVVHAAPFPHRIAAVLATFAASARPASRAAPRMLGEPPLA